MSRRSGLFCALAAFFVATPSLAAQDATPVAVPLFQPVRQFGAAGPSHVPPDATLTASEEAAFRAAIEAMEPFPGYLYSGCHDRAHAAYMLLPAALRDKVMKIWVVAPGRYTAVLPGLIGLEGDGPAEAVTWGYHVALAYRNDAGEIRVMDPVLRPREVLTERQWFDLMTLPRMSLWTLTRGGLYLFEASDLNPRTGYASFVWNGNATAFSTSWIPANIARDAVGVDATEGVTCPEIDQRATDPGALLTFLQQEPDAVPIACRPSVTKFLEERTRWATRLGLPS